MPKLTIGNSTCKLEELTLSQYTDIRKLLSYQTSPQKSRFGYGVQTKYLLAKNGEFPTGLLYLVNSYLETLTNTTTIDKRAVPASKVDFTLSLPYTPYPEQIDAGEAARAFKRGIIVAPTGLGKSVIIALIINNLKVKTLVVVPSLELKSQLSAYLNQVFNNSPNIVVQNVDSIDVKDPTRYDCVIIDEYHHSAAKTYQKLNKANWSHTYYKFGLTATPFRADDNERLLLESMLSQVIYEIEYQTAVSKGYIVRMEAYYVTVPPTKIKGNEKSWPSMYSELVVRNQVRNDIIMQLLGRFHVNKLATICLVKEIAHGNLVSSDQAFSFVNGSNDERYLIELFNNEKIRVLIGTDSILGEGIDSKPCEVVIMAGLGKSRPRFMQGCGRGFRRFGDKESCKVIIFKDMSHKWTKAHFKEQCKTLKEEYDIEPIELFI